MSNSRNEDDFFIKIDDVEINDEKYPMDNDDYIIKMDNFNSSSSNNSDYFIKVDGGDIIEQNKEKNELYIMNDDVIEEKEEDNIPHYNSPEYAEYMSKLNKDSLKEISMESINNDDIAFKIKEEANKKYSKKQIQTFLFGLIGILFVASLMTFGFMLKDGTVTNHSTVASEEELSDFDFLLNVISVSGETSLSYYNDLKEFAESKSSSSLSLQKTKISEINKQAKENLEEVNSLKDYIDITNYSDIISLLKSRYENIIELCSKLTTANSSNSASFYNKYAKLEIEIVDSLNTEITKKLDYFSIPYKLKDNAIVFDN